MYLVKFTESRWKQEALSGGSIRLGSLRYYRKIEDPRWRDEDEGLGRVVVKTGQPITPDAQRRIFQTEDLPTSGLWTIDTGGTPLTGERGSFNCMIFCCSMVRKLRNLDRMHEIFETNAHYFIRDVWKFADGIAAQLQEIIKTQDTDLASKVTILSVVDPVQYSDAPKERVVDDENLGTFDASSLDLATMRQVIQKPIRFERERELRFWWVPVAKERGGPNRQAVAQATRDHIDVAPPMNSLSCKRKKIPEIRGKRVQGELCAHILRRFRDEGYRYGVTLVTPENRPNLASRSRSGFERTGLLGTLHVAGFAWSFFRGSRTPSSS